MELSTASMDDALRLVGTPDPAAVRELEDEVLLGLPQVHVETTHVVFGGMCARTIFVPAGVVLTGALTNCDNVCIVSGDITVTTDAGTQRLVGYHVLPAMKGAKRVGLTHADTWWTTVWRTELTDVPEIEDEFTGESERLATRRPGIEYEPSEQKGIPA